MELHIDFQFQEEEKKHSLTKQLQLQGAHVSSIPFHKNNS